MKKIVNYYNIDSDCAVERECLDFHYDMENPAKFEFTPKLDKMFQTLMISHPIVSMHCNEYRTKIHISGYQQTKNHGYSRTETTITISED